MNVSTLLSFGKLFNWNKEPPVEKVELLSPTHTSQSTSAPLKYEKETMEELIGDDQMIILNEMQIKKIKTDGILEINRSDWIEAYTKSSITANHCESWGELKSEDSILLKECSKLSAIATNKIIASYCHNLNLRCEKEIEIEHCTLGSIMAGTLLNVKACQDLTTLACSGRLYLQDSKAIHVSTHEIGSVVNAKIGELLFAGNATLKNSHIDMLEVYSNQKGISVGFSVNGFPVSLFRKGTPCILCLENTTVGTLIFYTDGQIILKGSSQIKEMPNLKNQVKIINVVK